MGERKKWNKDRVIKSRMAAEKSRPQKVKNKKKVRGNNYRKGARKLYGEGKKEQTAYYNYPCWGYRERD